MGQATCWGNSTMSSLLVLSSELLTSCINICNFTTVLAAWASALVSLSPPLLRTPLTQALASNEASLKAEKSCASPKSKEAKRASTGNHYR